MKLKGWLTLLIIFILLSSLTLGCSKEKSNVANQAKQPFSHTYFIFDTVVSLRVYDERMSDKQFSEVEALLKQIDQRMNRMEKGSEIDQINNQAGVGSVRVSDETFNVIRTALEYAAVSEGKFDPTVGPLVDLWGIGNEGAAIPSEVGLTVTLPLIDYQAVTLDEAAHTVRLAVKGMALDLGAIAKGYAADVIKQYLIHQGYQSAIIDMGGNIIAMGAKPDGNSWSIGIQDPAEKRGEHLGTLKVKDQTIVTSGIYERFFKEDGMVYHHILDTKNGYPVRNNLLSVTIVTEVSMDADAMSTTVFAMGLEEGRRYIESRGDAEAIFVTTDKRVYLTSGLEGKFVTTNGGYQLAQFGVKN